MRSRFDFNSVSEITGVFVILTTVTVGVLLTMTAHVQRWFVPVFELQVVLPAEDDLPTGSEALRDAAVLIAATTVGKVTEIRIDDETNVATATLRMQGELVEELREDASALVSLPFLSFLGAPTIKLAKGSRGGPLLFADGERKATLRKRAISETDLQEQLRDWDRIAREWNDKALKWEGYFDDWNDKAIKWEGYFDEWNQRAIEWEARMVKTWEQIDKELEEPDGKIQVFMTNLNLLLDHLANEGLVAWAMRDPEWNKRTQELLDSVQRGTDEAVELLGLVDALLAGDRPLPPPFDETLSKLPAVAESIAELIERVQGVVAQVELASMSFPVMASSIEKEMRSIPGFLIESQETLRQIEIMVRALQRHWLIRSYVDPRPAKGRIPVEELIGPVGGER